MLSRTGRHMLRRSSACYVARTVVSFLLFGIAGVSPVSVAVAQDALLSLDEAARLAVQRSPLLSVNEAKARAAREMAVAAAQRPDPVLKLGVNNVPIEGPASFDLNRNVMTMSSIGVMQELTDPSKLDARASLATRSAELAEATRMAQAAQVEHDTVLAWLERSFQQSRRELLQRQLAEAQLLLPAAEAAYRAGKGPQADLFAARAEVERLHDRIDAADALIATATTRLARWVGDRAVQRVLAPRPALDQAPPFEQHRAAVHLAYHPSVEIARRHEALATAEVALAERERDSDWTVELMYSRRGHIFTDMVSINLAMPLQWDRSQRQDRELSARIALHEAAQAQLEEELRMHTAEAQALRQEWVSLRERLSRYNRALLPLARQRSEATLTAYRAGTGELGPLLQARRMALDTEMERLTLEMDAARAWAHLHTLLGLAVVAPAASSAPAVAPNAKTRTTTTQLQAGSER